MVKLSRDEDMTVVANPTRDPLGLGDPATRDVLGDVFERDLLSVDRRLEEQSSRLAKQERRARVLAELLENRRRGLQDEEADFELRTGELAKVARTLSDELASQQAALDRLSSERASQQAASDALLLRVQELERRLPARPKARLTRRVIRQKLRRLATTVLGALPSKTRRSLSKWRSLVTLLRTPLFERDFYRRQNPDIDIHPVWHYYLRGSFERRDPSPFFNTNHYLEHNPDVARAGVNALTHYLVRGKLEGRNPSPLFETAYYLSENPDVARAGVDPLAHFIARGAAEDRAPASARRIREFLAPYALGTKSDCANYLRAVDVRGDATPSRQRIDVYVHSASSPPHLDLRNMLVAGLSSHGHDVRALHENAPRRDRAHHVIVAPHEFLFVDKGQDWESDRRLADTIFVTSDRPHRAAFTRCLPFLFRAKCVLDGDYQVAAGLRELGVPAHFLPFGPLDGCSPYGEPGDVPDEPALRILPTAVRAHQVDPCAALSTRPLDFAFMGAFSDRRGAFLANNAELFSRYHSFLALDPAGSTMSAAAKVALCRRSKVLLNVHRDASSYFDWHTIVMLGLWQQALVITERSYQVPWLKPGTHYLEASLEEIPSLLTWVLDTEEGRRQAEQVRSFGHAALRQHYDFKKMLGLVAAHFLQPIDT